MTRSEKSPAPSTSRVVREGATNSATQPKRATKLTLSAEALAKAETRPTSHARPPRLQGV
jgi:hypothetical protein